jgi:small subunit ribosomal protein S17
MTTKTATKTAQGEGAKGAKFGVVESDKRDKTRTVVLRFLSKHPKYGKYVAHKTVLNVHDEANQSRAGDLVEIVPCRPMSKSKTWRLARVVERRSGIEPVAVNDAAV